MPERTTLFMEVPSPGNLFGETSLISYTSDFFGAGSQFQHTCVAHWPIFGLAVACADRAQCGTGMRGRAAWELHSGFRSSSLYERRKTNYLPRRLSLSNEASF